MKKTRYVLRLIFSILAFVVHFSLMSCNYGLYVGLFGADTVDERSSSMRAIEEYKPDFSVQTPTVPESTFSALVVTDLHFGASWGDDNEQVFLDWLKTRFESGDAEKIPRFIVNLGDTADGGHTVEFKDFVAFENKVKQLAQDCGVVASSDDYRIYSILGNHDLYNDGASGFEEWCFPHVSSYYFHAGGFGFYFLDTANGTLGTSQLADFKERISSDASPKLVFTHYPIYAGAGEYLLMRIQNAIERNTILTYFAKYNVKQIYEGHIHARTWHDFTEFREDVIDSFRNGQAAIFTMNSETGTVSTEVIEF